MRRSQATKPARSRVATALLANLGAIGVIMALGLFCLFSLAISHSFTALEDKEIAAHIARIEDFKQTNLNTIEARSKDWAVWDDTYHYAQDFNAQYVTSNLNAASFENAQVDGQVVVQSSTGAMRSYAFDRAKGKPWPALAAALAELVRHADLPARLREREALQSFVTLNGAVYLMGAANIHRSDGSGTSPGYLVFVQRTDSANATKALQVPAEFALGRTAPAPGIVKTAHQVLITSTISDFADRPIGALTLTIKRPLMEAADDLLWLSLAGAIVVVAVMLLALHWRLRRLVLVPLENLQQHIEMIRRTGELQQLEGNLRNDEFGAVQAEFNSMTSELLQLRARVESQSFALGKSQSAIGLVHNLRNCLSPVRVMLDTLERDLSLPRSQHLPRALEELAEPSTDQLRREKLAQFLSASLDQQDAQVAVSRQTVREAARNLMNAFSAIDSAQADKSETRFDERCEVTSMLSHACNIVRFSDGAPIQVEVRAIGNVLAQGNRVLLSQVFENLVTNAMESVRKSGREDGAIVLEAVRGSSEEPCRIVITDNGIGFDKKTGLRMFERGFSTRKSRSGGLGLHWCANTLKAMGGELSLSSEGIGHGAKAKIELVSLAEDVQGASLAA